MLGILRISEHSSSLSFDELVELSELSVLSELSELVVFLGGKGWGGALSLVFRLPAQCGFLGLCGLFILAFSEVFELSVRSELAEVAQLSFLFSLTSLRPLRCLRFFALGDFLWPLSSLSSMSVLMSELLDVLPRSL